MSSHTTHSVILVRHGQTALNAEGRLRGLADPELTPTGVEQARDTAETLRHRGIARVVSSPLLRAVTTARAIADATGAEFTVDVAWSDRDYGPWTGHRTADVIAEWGSVDDAPDVEPRSSVAARASRALEAVAGTPHHEPIAVVTHDVIIRCLLAAICPDLTPQVETGSWAELTNAGDGWSVASVDNTG